MSAVPQNEEFEMDEQRKSEEQLPIDGPLLKHPGELFPHISSTRKPICSTMIGVTRNIRVSLLSQVLCPQAQISTWRHSGFGLPKVSASLPQCGDDDTASCYVAKFVGNLPRVWPGPSLRSEPLFCKSV
ncbi:hypothetical protein TNCV_4930861 [Trichonephila clavipes]|nr:hypothetical protein TNCV_4930861 [Trichonephila clavipes]